MTDLGANPFDDKGNPVLDNDRKFKVLEIAKLMRKSCYQLSVAFQDGQWLVVCSAVIKGVLYQTANTIDTFSAVDHADLFKLAFSKALKEHEEEQAKPRIIH